MLTNFTGATPGSVTHNYYSGQQVIETRDGTPDAFAASLPVHYQYIWSARGNNSLILRDDFTQTPGTTAARLYYLNDANFNVTALVGNVSGVWQPVERYAYDPYGNVTVYDPTWATVRTSGSLYHNTILFAGCALDPLTGLYQMGARYYDSAIGRFISRDPPGYLGSPINLYAYCGDNPLNYTDPTGLTWYKPWTWGLNTEGTVGNRQIGERWQIDGTWFEEVQLPDGTRTPLPVGSRVVNDPDGGYHIQYPDGHVSHAGRPDNCAPGFRTLFLYYATDPTVATTICYIVGDLGISVVTVGYPLPVIPVPGIWDVPPGGKDRGAGMPLYLLLVSWPGLVSQRGFFQYRPGGSHSGYSGFYWTGPAGLPSPAPLFANPAAFSAWALASIAAEIADINAFLAWLRAYLAAPKPPTGYFGTPAQAPEGG